MEPKLIEIDGHVITVTRKSIKNIYLRLKPPLGSITITAPVRASLASIEQFVTAKWDWIKKQQAVISQQKVVANYNYETGEKIYYQGKEYIINTIYNKGNKVIIDGDENIINLYASRRGFLTLRMNIINRFFKSTIDEQLQTILPKWQSITRTSINNYRIRDMKSRWGSCNITDKNICLNLQLAKFDPICLEYVLVHELVHLFERKHNKRFYALMTKFMPDWQQYEKLLNTTSLR